MGTLALLAGVGGFTGVLLLEPTGVFARFSLLLPVGTTGFLTDGTGFFVWIGVLEVPDTGFLAWLGVLGRGALPGVGGLEVGRAGAVFAASFAVSLATHITINHSADLLTMQMRLQTLLFLDMFCAPLAIRRELIKVRQC